MIGPLATTIFVCILGASDAARMRSASRFNEFLSQGMEQGMQSQAQNEQKMDTAVQTAANGLQEVIEVLRQMLSDFDAQMIEDKKLWTEYSDWSSTSETDKRDFIQEQNSLIMSETAKKEANEQMVATLTSELATLANEIAQTKMGIKELIQMRKEEHEAFQTTQADLTQTIKAVVKATEILEGHYAAQGSELAQIKQRVQIALTMYGPSRIRTATKENLQALAVMLQTGQGPPSMLQTGQGEFQSNPDFLNTDGSKYDNYEKQGGAKGVITMLEDLHSELQSQLETAIAREAEARRQYEETKLAKETELKNQEDTQAKKTQEKETAEATIEECISTIDQAKKDILDAEEFLRQLLADREKFTKEFGERSSMRSDEQAATQAALDALQSVSAGAKSTVGFAQTSSSVWSGFLQISSSSTNQRLQRVAKKLANVGKRIQSVSLIQLSNSVQQTQSQEPSVFSSFDPVIKLLTDLIARLEEEASAETSQHEWCETEKTTSVTAKEQRETSIVELKAKINEQTTLSATLKTDILFLESEIARVEKETADAKALRKEQHDAYVKAKADHEEVIKAIGLALEALSGQYGGAAFIQVGSSQNQAAAQNQAANQAPGQAAVFSDYKSGGSGAGSAIEMLNDLQSRYTTALQEIEQTEVDQQKAHDELVATNEQFIADTTNTRNMKLKERRAKLGELGDAKTEIKTNLIELHDVNKYLQNLRPSCDDIRTTYEERKKRREAEIAALKEALEVISDPSMMSSDA